MIEYNGLVVKARQGKARQGYCIVLYYKDLEKIIFNKHLDLDSPDELVIISGYLGPSPIKRLTELPLDTVVIGGMYSQGVNKKLFCSLKKIEQENSSLNLLFSKIDIHSKIYIWKKKGDIVSALIGSANFSRNGLCIDFRESLADATNDTFLSMNEYLKIIVDNSTNEPNIIDKSTNWVDFTYQKDTDATKNLNLKFSYDIPLFANKNGKNYVPERSGLNWGFSNGHVAVGDAYIRIPKDLLKQQQRLVQPYDKNYISLGNKKRNSDPIEIIWDDGTIMEASLEGNQMLGGLTYPKQLTSYSRTRPFVDGKCISVKSILGRYLRSRLGIDVNQLITMEILQNYGRTDITLSLIEQGVYFADFSVR